MIAKKNITLGNIEKSFIDKTNSTITIVNSSSNNNEDIVIDETKFPNELPSVPQMEAQGLFSSIIIFGHTKIKYIMNMSFTLQNPKGLILHVII